MTSKIVEVKDLYFSYAKENTLNNISFDIREKEFVGLIGPNGGGKTTLIKILLGLLPNYKGQVKVFSARPLKFPHKIAYLSQQLIFDPAIPITVNEVVLMGCLGHRITGFYTKKDRENAHRAMQIMNVTDYKDSFFSSLSGGQKQRVLIARALTCNPKLLILDEPSVGIDNHHEQILFDLLKELNKEMAVIVVSHEYHFVSKLVDYVICINQDSHIHYPHEITPEHFQGLISKRYKYITHNHPVSGI